MGGSALVVAICVFAAARMLHEDRARNRLRRRSGVSTGGSISRRRVDLVTRRVGARAARAPSASVMALVLDLVGAAIAAGAPPSSALGLVGDAVGGEVGRELIGIADALALGAQPQVAWAAAPGQWAPLRRCLRLADASGAPISALLREAATQIRDQAQRDALVASARLSVRVVLPLGLCALPSFVLLGVVPVVLAIGGQLLGG